MLTFSASATLWKALLLLSIASLTLAGESTYDDEYDTSESLTDDDFDQIPLESSKTEVFLDPNSKQQDSIKVEESKGAPTFIKDEIHAKSPNKIKIKMQNVTEEEYNYVQWYSEPTHINHHIGDSERLGSGSQNKGTGDDLNAQSSSYEEGYSGDRDHYSHHHSDDHHYDDYHENGPQQHGHHEGYSERDPTNHNHDHHDGHYHYDNDGAQVHSFHHTKSSSGEEKSVFPEKRKLKKIRKKCPHSKNKKEHSGRSESMFHSMSKTGAEVYDSKIPGAVTQARFNTSPKLESVLPHLAPSGLTGPHLHTTPRAQYFNQKASGKGNIIHLHNHHHHYNAEGKRIMLHNEPAAGQGYGNLMQSLGKLRSLLPIALAGMAGKQNQNQASQGFQQPQSSQGVHLPTENGIPDVKLAQDSPKLGYHYTGPHNSYGRKTYYRVRPGESDPSSVENSRPSGFGYGSGESTQDVPYPNDGAYNPDVPHPNNGGFDIGSDMVKYGAGPYGTDEFQDSADKHYPNEVSLNVDKDPHHGRYHPDPHSHSEYGQHGTHPHDGPSPGPYHDHPADYDSGLNHDTKDTYSPDYEEKAPYVPYDQIKATREKDHGGGYGLRNISPHSPEPLYENNGHHDIGDLPNGPPPKDTVSYVQDGVDQHFYDPEKDYKYRDLKPEPDPLSIPKNARVIEHHIRLHPMLYTMFQPLPLDMPPGPGAPFPAQGFQRHIPVHKLIPNPLKMPNHVAPPVAAHPNPHLNEMLHAYQSRNVYRKWW